MLVSGEINFRTAIEGFLRPEKFKDKKSVKEIIDFLRRYDKAIDKAIKSDRELESNLDKLSQRFKVEAKYGKKNPKPLETLLWLSCMHPRFNAEERIALASKTPNLKVLDLNSTDLTDEQLAFVAQTFPNLETLNIRKCNELTLEGYKNLQEFKQLKILYVSESDNFDNEALKYLPLSLEKLWTRNNGDNISIAGMEALSKLVNLNTLVIRGCKITDDCLPYLCGLNLTVLDLHRCREITDVALKEITTFEKIEELNFCDCKNITEDGFKALLSLSGHLKKVIIKGCNPVSEELMEEFKKNGIELTTQE